MAQAGMPLLASLLAGSSSREMDTPAWGCWSLPVPPRNPRGQVQTAPGGFSSFLPWPWAPRTALRALQGFPGLEDERCCSEEGTGQLEEWHGDAGSRAGRIQHPMPTRGQVLTRLEAEQWTPW